LACTTFKFTDLRAEASEVTPETGLDEVVLTVSFTVINTGGQRGVAVPQLYLGYLESSVDRPSRELRGFQHLELGRGKRSC
jgi:glycosyl hydrolase family 3 C-terminal domain protein